jgi:hypothetical protein
MTREFQPGDGIDRSNEHIVSGLRALGAADPGPEFAARVMDRIGSRTPRRVAERPLRRMVHWLVSPRTFRLSPLGGLAAAAGLVLALGLALRLGPAVDGGAPRGLSPVTFVLAAPDAREVAVIGSFNGWNAAGWTMRRDAATGLWTLAAALPPGSHEYVFLIDGATSVPDASAPFSADDGFGSRNSVLLVKGGDESVL